MGDSILNATGVCKQWYVAEATTRGGQMRWRSRSPSRRRALTRSSSGYDCLFAAIGHSRSDRPQMADSSRFQPVVDIRNAVGKRYRPPAVFTEQLSFFVEPKPDLLEVFDPQA